MTDHTPAALASALPAGIMYDLGFDPETPAWRTREIAAFQAGKLAESGYVLVHTAPDEATVERLARAVFGADGNWDLMHPDAQNAYYKGVRLVLAALAGTSAQARHTDDSTGGGEDG